MQYDRKHLKQMSYWKLPIPIHYNNLEWEINHFLMAALLRIKPQIKSALKDAELLL